MKDTVERMRTRFSVSQVDSKRNDLAFITVPRGEAVAAISWLRDSEGYRHLVLISVVDLIERGVFQMTYILHNYSDHCDIAVRAEIDREDAHMDSIHHLWAGAQVYQRELKEMYGIDFPGSPRVDEPMILEGWDNIPPMRREFDTRKYSEETFFPREGRETHDPAAVMAEKNYPGEEKVKKAIKKLVREKRGEGKR